MAAETKRPAKRRRLIIGGVILCLAAGFCWFENTHLTVTEYTCPAPAGFEGYKIVQLSDPHDAQFGRDNARLVTLAAAQAPDIIVLTGDMIDAYRTNIPRAIGLASALTEICDVYYVNGNHEAWLSEADAQALYDGLADAGVTLLLDEQTTLSRGGDTVTLLGIRDESLQSDMPRRMAEETADAPMRILLAHEPQYLDEYAHCGYDLVLTGHAHGGQWRLPIIGGVIAPDQGFDPVYYEGMHTEGDTRMVISRGLGNSTIPVRLFNDPEIVVVTLTAE